MLNRLSSPLFFLILMSGTLITTSSSSWLGAWMGLEINLLAFIPLMNTSSNLMSSEAALKYFLIQVMASIMLIFTVIMSYITFYVNEITEIKSLLINIAIICTLMLKVGAAPLHFWFPSVMEGLPWIAALVLMTWQKIAPLMLTTYIISKTLLTLFIIMSLILGSLGGLNQTSIRKIMSFSSINHIGWMLIAMLAMNKLWMVYFSIYSFLTTTLILFFNSMKSFHVNQLFSISFKSNILKFCIFLNLLSLGGLPPFLGFFPKWITIQFLAMHNQAFLMILAVIFTLITLFFYLRMTYSAFMLNSPTTKWYVLNYNINNQQLLMVLTSVSLMTLPYMSLTSLSM